MESFAGVVRSLLDRIRALQGAYTADSWPAGSAAGRSPLYQVQPTAWGLDEELPPYHPAPRAGSAESRTATVSEKGEPASTPVVEQRPRNARQRLELAAYNWPVPRGLLST